MNCPECGLEMQEAADWQDDWLVCLDCLNTVEMQDGLQDRPSYNLYYEGGL